MGGFARPRGRLVQRQQSERHPRVDRQVEEMSMMTGKKLAGIFFVALVASAVFLIPSRPVYAYTAGCVYNQLYSPEQIQDIVYRVAVAATMQTLNSMTPSPCTQADKAQVRAALIAANAEYRRVIETGDDPNATPEEKAARDAAVAKTPGANQPLACSAWYEFFSPVCWGRLFSVVIGTALIAVTAWLLAAVGLLFNLLVDHTIIAFGYLFNSTVQGAIGTAWSAFRDVANIVIIGMFVFIAINMILGVKEFGEKKKVARVLIIAVLLNFSLLFTKVIIDASNFTAMQFYKMSQLSSEGESGSLSFTTFEKKGISGQFIDLLGLKTLDETKNALLSASFGTAN